MRHLSSTVIRNALANLLRGAATAIVALTLPHFLVHSLDPARFSSWSLILQIAAYANYLDFGLQTAVARFMAQAIELNQLERKQKLISTALALLASAGLLAFLVIMVVVWMLPRFFHGVPADIVNEVRTATVVLGSATALLLPSSVYTGVLVGLQRNDVPAIAIGSSRLVGALAVILVSHYTHSLIALATCIAIPNLFGGLSQFLAVGRLLPEGGHFKTPPNRAIAQELLQYCAGLLVFSVAMFLVTGLDTTIVGHYAFLQVGYYAIAASVITFAFGINGAVTNALLSPIAALHARNEFERIRSMILATTRFTTGINLLVTGLLLFFGKQLLTLWVGKQYAIPAYSVLVILMLAQTVRQMASPYSLMLTAAGQQLKAAENAISEGLVNIVVSIVAAAFIGALGVAGGTLVGAVVGVVWVVARTFKRETDIAMTPSAYLGSVLPFILASVPLVGIWGLTRFPAFNSSQLYQLTGIASLILTFILFAKYCRMVPNSVRQQFKDRFRWVIQIRTKERA